ncbi:MAG: diguanylate cyclase [Rubrivivax sp.]|nr:diguanylate cyclase [Rubrivivax sp.]
MAGVHPSGLLRLATLVWLVLAPAAGAAESRLEVIERTLRGQPQAALRALEPVLAETRGVDHLPALILRGSLQVRVPDEDAAEATARELEALAPVAPLATAAAGLVRAGIWARHTPLGRADRALTGALAALPADAPDGMRLRFIAAQASVRQTQGKLDEAVALYQQAVNLADRAGPPWRRAELRSALAYVFFMARQQERAIALNAEATRLAVQADDLYAQVNAANADAIFAAAQGRAVDELRASQHAIALARRSGSKRLVVVTTANLADFYLKRREFTTALRLAQQALPLARELDDPSSEALALTNAGLAQIGLGRVDEGSARVRQALLMAERAGDLPTMAGTQGELGHALESAGRLPEAWAAYVEHRRLSDEVFQRQHQEAVLELQEGQDAERRQRELTALETENGLKEAQLLGRELQQRLWVLGLLAGVLLLAVVALLLRRMRQSNARLRSSNAELQAAGERDPLTGLANRRHFQAVMQQTAAVSFEGSLLLIDLDHFKQINDRHGHAAGDAVLVAMAQRLRAALREEDLTVRWGGEEFLIVVRSLPPEQVEALAERLLATIGSQPVGQGLSVVPVTASIGFATFPLLPAREPIPWERAVDVVDTALYLAKAHGRNRAYGVRALRAEATAEGAAGAASPPAHGLEHAWREGHAELAQLSGPQPAASTA